MVLMLYPDVISAGLWLWDTGIALTAGLFLFKD